MNENPQVCYNVNGAMRLYDAMRLHDAMRLYEHGTSRPGEFFKVEAALFFSPR
jgi:hypothetical protein